MEEKSCKVAAIDLGTQTFRLLAAEIKGSSPKILCSLRKNVRLGQGLIEKGRFSKEAIDRAEEALCSFANYIKRHDIEKLMAIGTEAFRISENAELILNKAQVYGIDIEIISPKKEAELSVKGAFLTLPNVKDPWIMLDSGGGSTEIVKCQGEKALNWHSIKLGAVSVTEEYNIKKDAFEGYGLKKFIREKLDNLLKDKDDSILDAKEIVATGGTATTVSAVMQGLSPYDPKRVRGHKIRLCELEKLFRDIIVKSVNERKKIKGLEPERADIFPSGIAILIEIIRYLGLKDITISDGGILLGLLATTLEKECNFYVKPSSARSLYV